tara:strand:+ start:36384 stop:36623 length:240 start_codon:yes stop_codon:yes gene_type:complete
MLEQKSPLFKEDNYFRNLSHGVFQPCKAITQRYHFKFHKILGRLIKRLEKKDRPSHTPTYLRTYPKSNLISLLSLVFAS